MRKLIIEQGQRFGKLVILHEVESKVSSNRTKRRFRCECECGKITETNLDNLNSGRSKSCGCDTKKNKIQSSIVHNLRYTNEYITWCNMKQRCYNEKHSHFNYYGGRGIKVCDRWLNSFQSFYEDMGPKPTEFHSIDRINVNGDYEPTNCRWATPQQQSLNRRKYEKLPKYYQKT